MTVRELTRNPKAAFDTAEAGQTVLITRKGKVFMLTQMQTAPSTTFATVQKGKLFAVNGQDEIKLHDGSTLRFTPEEPKQ